MGRFTLPSSNPPGSRPALPWRPLETHLAAAGVLGFLAFHLVLMPVTGNLGRHLAGTDQQLYYATLRSAV